MEPSAPDEQQLVTDRRQYLQRHRLHRVMDRPPLRGPRRRPAELSAGHPGVGLGITAPSTPPAANPASAGLLFEAIDLPARW